MAAGRNRTKQAPEVDAAAVPEVDDVGAGGPELTDDPTPEVEAGPLVVSLNVPLADKPSGYAQQHVDLRLTPKRAAVLNRLFHALRDRPLPGANPQAEAVTSAARAVMYLIDAIGDAADRVPAA